MKINYKKIISLFFCMSFCHLPFLNADIYEGAGIFEKHSLDFRFFDQFLPYNPVVLEVGAFRGEGVLTAAKLRPKARIIAFEADPYALRELEKNVEEARLTNVEIHSLAVTSYNGFSLFNLCLGPNGNEPAYGCASSTLPLEKGMEIYCKGPQIMVPCVNLDSWCKENRIEKIDVLRLEVEGAEFSVLKSSPNTLKNARMIHVQTQTHPHRLGTVGYPAIKEFLEKNNFVLVSHKCQPEIIGHAIFFKRELFDAYFKQCLGLYLEN